MNNQLDAVGVAVAKGKASLCEFELAKASRSASRIAVARLDLQNSRREILRAQAEKSAFDSMRSALAKGVNVNSGRSDPFAKAAVGRKAGAFPFLTVR